MYIYIICSNSGYEYSTMHKGGRGPSTGQRSVLPQVFQPDLQKHNLILGEAYTTVPSHWKFCLNGKYSTSEFSKLGQL